MSDHIDTTVTQGTVRDMRDVNIENLQRRMAEMEVRVSEQFFLSKEATKYGQRLHDFKEEINQRLTSHLAEVRALLERHNAQRAEDEQKFAAHFNALGEGVNMFGQGLNRLETRTNMIWNTFNALTRLIELTWTGQSPVPCDRAEFEAAFKEAGRQVFDETIKHEKAELARMREEKARTGKVQSPMAPRTPAPADNVLQDMGDKVLSVSSQNREEFAELRSLRQESIANNRGRLQPETELSTAVHTAVDDGSKSS